MERLNFIDNKKQDLENYRAKYDEKYDQSYLDEFYQVTNFRNIWSNSKNFIVSSMKGRETVKQELLEYAAVIYNDLINDNSDSMAMLDFTFYCAKEKYNIYPIIYTYKLHAEILRIAKNNITNIRKASKIDFRKELKIIDKKVLNLYDTEENINLIFKLLCESCGEDFPYADDVFTIVCYFLSNLIELRPLSVQNKLLILFEKRPYSHKFFKHVYTSLNSYAYKLNNTNFVDKLGDSYGSVSQPNYLIDEGREKQMLRIIDTMCSRLNYAMKNYMSIQKYSDQSYDLVEATITCMRALLPYMHYQVTYDNLLACLSTILEFVDGDSRSDYNTQNVLDLDFISLASSILNLNYYNPPSNYDDTLENIENVVKFNFLSLNNRTDDLSVQKN